MPLTDYEIVKLILAGQDDAFAELVGRYKNILGRVIFNLNRNRDEVNDILQEVFLKIYKSLKQYNPEYKFGAWSTRIAANHCLDQLRKQKPYGISLEEVELHSNAASPEEEYLKDETRRKLQQTLNELPEEYRILIVLYHQNGLSYQEMVKLLDLPLTTVKNRLYRARLMLRETLTGEKEALP